VAPGTRPAIAGGSEEASTDPGAVAASERLAGGTRRLVQPEVVGLAVVCAVATVFFGLIPAPLFELASQVGTALGLR
jgi:hypothetical protein